MWVSWGCFLSCQVCVSSCHSLSSSFTSLMLENSKTVTLHMLSVISLRFFHSMKSGSGKCVVKRVMLKAKTYIYIYWSDNLRSGLHQARRWTFLWVIHPLFSYVTRSLWHSSHAREAKTFFVSLKDYFAISI